MKKIGAALFCIVLVSCFSGNEDRGIDGHYPDRFFATGYIITKNGSRPFKSETDPKTVLPAVLPNIVEFILPDLELKNGKANFYVSYDSEIVARSKTYFPGSDYSTDYSIEGDSLVLKSHGYIVGKIAQVSHESLCPSGAEILIYDVKYLMWSFINGGGNCQWQFVDTLDKKGLQTRDTLRYLNSVLKAKVVSGGFLITKIGITEKFSGDSVERHKVDSEVESLADFYSKYYEAKFDSIRIYSLESIWKK